MKKIPVVEHHQEIEDYKLATNITYWIGVASGILISLGVAGIIMLIITFV